MTVPVLILLGPPDASQLVSVEIVLATRADRTDAPVQSCSIILAGFPRTLVQAEALDELLPGHNQKVAGTISLDVDDATMADRMAVPFACASCAEGYHHTFKHPVQAGVCDRCDGTAFKRRADDTAETVRDRLTAYHARTAQLNAHYDGRGVLQRIDAMRPIAAMRDSLSEIVTRVSA